MKRLLLGIKPKDAAPRQEAAEVKPATMLTFLAGRARCLFSMLLYRSGLDQWDEMHANRDPLVRRCDGTTSLVE